MDKYVVSVTRIPTNYHPTTSYVVEAASPEDARLIVKDYIKDLSDRYQFVYETKPYAPPPPGRVIATNYQL